MEDAPEAAPAGAAVLEALPLDTGLLSLGQVNLMPKTLPVDISLVDEHDTVRYYSDTPHRAFPRSPGVIGRKVHNCHPQKSVHLGAEGRWVHAQADSCTHCLTQRSPCMTASRICAT